MKPDWNLAFQIACNVEPNAGQGRRSDINKTNSPIGKKSCREVGVRVGLDGKTANKYLRAWNKAASHGLVPHSSDLRPDSDIVEFPLEPFESFLEKTGRMVETPKFSFVYKFWRDGELLYVGKANDLESRIKDHHSLEFSSRWVDSYTHITAMSYPSEAEALKAERLAIETEGPWYNAVFNVRGEIAWD